MTQQLGIDPRNQNALRHRFSSDLQQLSLQNTTNIPTTHIALVCMNHILVHTRPIVAEVSPYTHDISFLIRPTMNEEL